MPLVNVKVIEGVSDENQKRAMVEKLTDAMVAVEGENMRAVTWVVIEEVRGGDWAIGGKRLTARDGQGSRRWPRCVARLAYGGRRAVSALRYRSALRMIDFPGRSADVGLPSSRSNR
jgi:4-oxalocrotonate tautomerase